MRKKKVVIYLFYNGSTSSVVFQEEYFKNIRYVIYISHDHDDRLLYIMLAFFRAFFEHFPRKNNFSEKIE